MSARGLVGRVARSTGLELIGLAVYTRLIWVLAQQAQRDEYEDPPLSPTNPPEPDPGGPA